MSKETLSTTRTTGKQSQGNPITLVTLLSSGILSNEAGHHLCYKSNKPNPKYCCNGTEDQWDSRCSGAIASENAHPTEDVRWNWSILAPGMALHPGNGMGGYITAEPPLWLIPQSLTNKKRKQRRTQASTAWIRCLWHITINLVMFSFPLEA